MTAPAPLLAMEHITTDPDNSGTLPDKAPLRPFYTSTGELTPEGRQALLTMDRAMIAAFRSLARSARRASSRLGLLGGLLLESQRGPTIGRKRRARRDRGRARENR